MGVGIDHHGRSFDVVGRDQAGLAPQQDVVEAVLTHIGLGPGEQTGGAFESGTLGVELDHAIDAQAGARTVVDAHVGTVPTQLERGRNGDPGVATVVFHQAHRAATQDRQLRGRHDLVGITIDIGTATVDEQSAVLLIRGLEEHRTRGRVAQEAAAGVMASATDQGLGLGIEAVERIHPQGHTATTPAAFTQARATGAAAFVRMLGGRVDHTRTAEGARMNAHGATGAGRVAALIADVTDRFQAAVQLYGPGLDHQHTATAASGDEIARSVATPRATGARGIGQIDAVIGLTAGTAMPALATATMAATGIAGSHGGHPRRALTVRVLGIAVEVTQAADVDARAGFHHQGCR